jgi:hypothetical protein
MKHYFFDVKDGHRLIDPAGLDCRDDKEAREQAIVIARQIATDVPGTSGGRNIAILNSERQEIATVPVSIERVGEDHGREQACWRQRAQGSGEETVAAADHDHGQKDLDKAGPDQR